MTTRRLNIIADDYGLSPGISSAIRELISQGRITGTGCMTLFPEWLEEARALRKLRSGSKADIGLHLTLTDFTPLSGGKDAKRLPPLRGLLGASLLGSLDQAMIEAELDAQLESFVDGMGRLPDFIDGHQHVHFLPAVRRWFETRWHRLEYGGRLPWLRGAPSLRLAPDNAMKAKIAFVRVIAAGFDQRMKSIGFPVRGPLTGFYDWKRPEKFEGIISQLDNGFPEETVLMCHPGWIDQTLASRDTLVAARQAEFQALITNSKLMTLDQLPA